MNMSIARGEETIELIIPTDWSAKDHERTFSSNELISAYLKGKEHAKDEGFERFKKQLNSNLTMATGIAKDLLRTLEENKIELVGIHLKAVSVKNFEFLCVVSKESFESDNFINAYIITHKVKNQYQLENVNLDFSYLGENQDVSEECLAADGYFLHYNHEQTAKA